MYQTHWFFDKTTKPIGGDIARIRYPQGVAPDGDTPQIRVDLRHRNVQCLKALGIQGQAARSVPERRELAHFGVRTLGKKAPASLIHQHPASITNQPQLVQPGLEQAFAFAGLKWKTIKRA